MTKAKAIRHIEAAGMLLVYPIDNQPEPASLWSAFFPKSRMRWEWDTGGDDRVANLWRLREELSRSEKVVYAKWYKGRATFFSKEVFTAALARLWFLVDNHESLVERTSREILGAFELSSPLSTKEIKRESGLVGKDFERDYEKAMRTLWRRLLVVGYGEKDDGAFPSLMMGATSLLFEELWHAAARLTPSQADSLLSQKIGPTPFYKYLQSLLK